MKRFDVQPLTWVLPHDGRHRRRCVGAWSLLELLVVIAVMTILMGASTLAFRGLLQSTGRQAAVDQVLAGFEQARSLAVSQSRGAYVVFADEQMDEPYRCRAFSIYLDNEDPEKLEPAAQTGWLKLPVGICFRNDLPSVVNAALPESAPAFHLPGSTATRAVHYVKFDRTGAVEYPTGPESLKLILCAGNVNASGVLVKTSKSDEHAALEQITLARFTGRAKYQLVQAGRPGE